MASGEASMPAREGETRAQLATANQTSEDAKPMDKMEA